MIDIKERNEWFKEMMDFPKEAIVYFLDKANDRAKFAEALNLLYTHRTALAVEDALLQYNLVSGCKQFSTAKKFIAAGNARLNFLLKKQKLIEVTNQKYKKRISELEAKG